MKLLHNPRCSKSRQALQWLTEQGISPEVVDYQKTPLTRDALQALAKQLNLGSLKDMMRAKDDLFAELNLHHADEAALLDALVLYPQLLERPIFITPHGATIGRPLENLAALLQQSR